MNFQKQIEEMEDLDQLEYNNSYVIELSKDWNFSFDVIKLYGVQIISVNSNSTQYECILLDKLKCDISKYTLCLSFIEPHKYETLDSFLAMLNRQHIEIYNVEFLSDTCIRFWTPDYWDPSIYDFTLTNVY